MYVHFVWCALAVPGVLSLNFSSSGWWCMDSASACLLWMWKRFHFCLYFFCCWTQCNHTLMLQNNYNIIIMHILYTVLLYIVAIHTLYIALLHRDALMYSYLRYIPCRLMNCALWVMLYIYYTTLSYTILYTILYSHLTSSFLLRILQSRVCMECTIGIVLTLSFLRPHSV